MSKFFLIFINFLWCQWCCCPGASCPFLNYFFYFFLYKLSCERVLTVQTWFFSPREGSPMWHLIQLFYIHYFTVFLMQKFTFFDIDLKSHLKLINLAIFQSHHYHHFFEHPLQLMVIKGTLGGFLIILFVVLPGRELSPDCGDRIPASYHLSPLTPSISLPQKQ